MELRKKKILFITSGISMGGIERVLSTCINKLSKDYSIDVLCIERKKKFYEIDPNITFLYSPRLFATALKFSRYIHNGIKKFLNINLELKFVSMIFNLKIKKKSYDTIVYLPSSFFMCPYIIKKNKYSKNIMWTHNNFLVYLDDYYKYMKSEFIESLQISDLVIALTDEDKKGFTTLSESNNIIKINNPLTIENYGKFSNLENKTICITCRYSIKHKGLDYLMQIANNIPKDWKISIAGSGTEEEMEILKQLINKNNVKDSVVLLGALKGQELLDHYKNSSIYVMTSRWEGFGLVLTEAMSFGLPIIAFENSGANEVLDNGKYGILVEQGDVDKFSKELNLMISDFDLRQEYSKKSLERVKDFEIDKIINQWKAII